jgi:type II secretory pathway component PulJ
VNLLVCLIGMTLCTLLLHPLLQSSTSLLLKQTAVDQSQIFLSDADRAMELMGRAIRMAGYRNNPTEQQQVDIRSQHALLAIEKHHASSSSDALIVRHEQSHGIDLDCVGNSVTKERTQQHLVLLRFWVQKKSSLSNDRGRYVSSLMCQSLDRHGRKHNSTLMNGVDALQIEELNPIPGRRQRSFRIRLIGQADPARQRIVERIFTTRNLP